MNEIYFIVRHTPFWGIPFVVLGAEFGYLFWLKKKKASVMVCLMLFLIGGGTTFFYVWAGGPEKAVNIIKKMHRDYK